MKKNILVSLLLLSVSFSVLAQQKKAPKQYHKVWQKSFFSRLWLHATFGLATTSTEAERVVNSGTMFSFAADYVSERYLFVRFIYDNVSQKYEASKITTYANVPYDGTLSSGFYTLNLGYRRNIKSFTPYLYTGAGIGNFEFPTVSTNNGITRLGNVLDSGPMYRIGLGTEYAFDKNSKIVMEISNLGTFNAPSLDNKLYETIPISLGFIMALF
jgi:hypothetical protein